MKRPLIASPPWTPEEEQRVRDGAVVGEHAAAIGKALGRTEQAVRHRMSRLGIPSKRALKNRSEAGRGAEGEEKVTKRTVRIWTTEEDERLLKLASEGRSGATIAERLKRTPSSVRNRARILKILLATVMKRN